MKPRGVRDFNPEDMQRRNFVLNKIRQVYENFGFRELETPAFESFELLTKKSGEELANSIFKFKDKGDRLLGLRFDLTVPMARFVAENPQLPKPFKRFQIGRVWRYEEPQAGRFREFWQADVDVVGSKEPESDVECIASIVSALENLGFKNFTVKVNSRKLLEDIAKNFGIKENFENLFRSIDKLEKIGKEEVKKELSDKGFKNIEKLLSTIDKEGKPETILKGIKGEEVEKLKEFFKIANSYGISNYLVLDLRLARGLDYYTGIVFEVNIKGAEKYGSVAGGGRYDNLIGLYGKEDVPATGGSIGVERILQTMQEKGMFKLKPMAKVLVVPIEGAREYAFQVAQKLRKQGISTDLDLLRRGPSKVLAYSNTLGIPYAIIIGEKELKAKKLTLRDMKTGKQETLKLEEILKKLL